MKDMIIITFSAKVSCVLHCVHLDKFILFMSTRNKWSSAHDFLDTLCLGLKGVSGMLVAAVCSLNLRTA